MDPLIQPDNETPQQVQPPVDDPGLSQDQMRTNLQDMMAKVDGKYQEFNAQKFSSDNQSQEIKSQVLRELFDLFESKGIDPNNPEEVKEFLDTIKQNNPELYQQVEQALKTLLNGDSESPEVQNEQVLPSPEEGSALV